MECNHRSCTTPNALDTRARSSTVNSLHMVHLTNQDPIPLVFFVLTVSDVINRSNKVLNICINYENYTCKSDCDDGEVRLVGGASESKGTVEVCLDNLWGLVAETGWSQTEAQVICKQLGLPLEGNLQIIETRPGPFFEFICSFHAVRIVR